jgi:hypothetical protein
LNPYIYAMAISCVAEGILPSGHARQHDQIALANESMFNEAYFSQPLTTYGVGYRDPRNIKETLDFIAPEVQVPRRFDYEEQTNAEEFLADNAEEIIRAIGADFKMVKPYTESKTHAETLNKGLTIRVDLDRVADKKNWRERAVAKLLNRIYRVELRQGVSLLSAAAVNTNKTWDTSAGKDPDHDLDTDLNAGETASGIRPNRVLFGETAWSKRRLSFRAQNNAGGYASAGMDEAGVAGYLKVDKVHVSRERYQSGAAAKSEIVNNLVLSFFGLDGADTEDPSNIKRFVSPVEGGGILRVYEQQISAKLYDITVEINSLIKITSVLGIRKFTIS